MIFKVGILGASGRMGQEIAALLSPGLAVGPDTLEFVDAVSRSASLTSLEGIAVRTLEDFPREPVHVWIDFSRPAATFELLEKTEAPVVIGTTGFTAEQLDQIEKLSVRRAILLSPNTSPGMSALRRLLKNGFISPNLGFSAVLEEEHHRHKKDSPSGTAKMLLGLLEEAGYKDVQVHVTRAGSTVGIHTIRLVGDGEELTFSHRVVDRNVFARGACLAAAFLARQKKPGLYRMEDVNL